MYSIFIEVCYVQRKIIELLFHTHEIEEKTQFYIQDRTLYKSSIQHRTSNMSIEVK